MNSKNPQSTTAEAIANKARLLKVIVEKFGSGKTLSEAELNFVHDSGSENPRLPIFPSMKACAGATGTPVSVLKESKDRGCDAFNYSRVNFALFIRWIFSHTKIVWDKDQPLSRSERKELDHWRAARERKRFEKEDAQLASKSDTAIGLKRVLSEMFGALDRVFCNELPPVLIGLREAEIREKAKQEIETIKTELRARFDQMIE